MTKDNLNIKTLVREPIDDVNKKIRIYKNKSIILSGPRGCGKTTVLKDLEQSGLGRFEQYIYTTFEGTGLYLLKPGKNFDSNFLEHYYEVLMSYKILEYIKKYYGLTYKKEFQEDGIVIKELLKQIDIYIQQSEFKKTTLNHYLKVGDLTSKLIKKIKSTLKIRNLNLCIDRFDWINTASETTQNTLKKYFQIFDKTIITTDEDKFRNRQYLQEYKFKGYEIIEVDYCNDIDVIKEIITKRIEEYNNEKKEYQKIIPSTILTEEIYKMLILKTEGNISLMIKCIDELLIQLNWNSYKFKLEDEAKRAIEAKVQQNNIYKRMILTPKLHI